ncbi:FAD /NAD-P-binding domain-containingprotein [Moniliophthora roreri]|uniref:Putative FAD/NAD-P-binding domain-containing protein n=1 Tax=Moniliophthora roreri TaxID=221103 RepID=A0A0W0EV10_MONRR|nr:FAD /NAD-P-binding domain-containingprotein [Moniliophthora roreri]
MADPREEPVAIIGSGAAGLISAQILLQDGFKSVQVITRDATVGGVWSEERVYPGLTLNNVYGEFRFSSMTMVSEQSGGRLAGFDMMQYMQKFADTHLRGHIRFGTEVLKIQRDDEGWSLLVENIADGIRENLRFKKVVLCTGGCSSPSIPSYLSFSKAKEAGFEGPIFHSFQFRQNLDDLLHVVKPDVGHVVIVGGGKSAQEFLPILAGHIDLKTRLERFLHTTWLGGKITQFIWNAIASSSFDAQGLAKDSPLRRAHSLFWSIRVNDEGAFRANSYFDLVNEGKIKVIAPARVTGYARSGVRDSLMLELNNGGKLDANAVILATGYTSSWTNLFDEQQAQDLGISRHQPSPANTTIDDRGEWPYTSLANPPPCHPKSEQWASSIFRGIVPAKSILRGDFAINGAVFSTNNGYTFEVMAHWISSYFLKDDMKIPKSPEEAHKEAEREARWMRRRHPDQLLWVNESYSSGLKFWTWPQYTDELLEDMGLRSMRSGGNWFTWPFKVIDLGEIASLGEERKIRRARTTSLDH